MDIQLNGWQDFLDPCYDPQERWGDCPATLLGLVMDERAPASDRIWAFANCALVPDSTKRLFAVRCVREIPTVIDLLIHKSSFAALDTAERFVAGQASADELSGAELAAWGAALHPSYVTWAATWAAAWAATLSATKAATWAAKNAVFAAIGAEAAAEAAQIGFIVDILRDETIF